MGGFSDNYECGYWDEDTPPIQRRQSIKNDNTLVLIEDKVYSQRNDLNYSYIMVLLTPVQLLSPEARDMRMNLSILCNTETVLEFIYHKDHEHGSDILEVYYDDISIGFVQKRVGTIDYTEVVDSFCFDQNSLKEIEVLWDGEGFCLRQTIGSNNMSI